MEKEKIVNRRVLTCEKDHKVHEAAFSYEDIYRINHRVRNLNNWKCPKCQSPLKKVELAILIEIPVDYANKISKGVFNGKNFKLNQG